MARRAVIEGSAQLALQEPRFAPLVESLGPAELRAGRPRRTHFAELVRAICYQQLAGAAARTIHGRFEAVLDGAPTPEAVLALPVETLRGAGLSGNKAASVRDLAQKVLDGDVELDRVARLSDDVIVRELTLVRGIGRWTAEMFLMFQLGRLDVWPVDDLGVRKGYACSSTSFPHLRPRRSSRSASRCARSVRSPRGTAGGRPTLSSEPRVFFQRARIVAACTANGGSPRRARRTSTAAGSSTGQGSSSPCSPSTNCDPYSWSCPSFMRTRSAR